MKIRQKSVSFAHQAARQWQGPPLSTAAFVMLGCCTTQLAVGSFSEQLLVHKLWQFSWSLWFGRHANLHALHSQCVFFLSHPGNVDVQLTRLCWMARAWIAWNVVWSVPPSDPRFTQPRRFQGLPVCAMRAEPINASQQTDAMPHRPLDWFVMWGSCCFSLSDEGCRILEFSPLEIAGFEEDFDGCGCGCCDSWGWPWLQQLNQLNQLSLCSRLPGGHVFELRARLLFFGWALRQMPQSVWS